MSAPGWIAVFRDGPLADDRHDRIFAVGGPWREIVLAPIGDLDKHGWTIVAGTGMPPLDEPWPGQATYRCADVANDPRRDGPPVAFYELAP